MSLYVFRRRNRSSTRRRGTGTLALAIGLAVGLVTLGVAGASLAGKAEAFNLGVAKKTNVRAPEPELPPEIIAPVSRPETVVHERSEPKPVLSAILGSGAESLGRWAVFADDALCIAGQASVKASQGGAAAASNGDIWLRGKSVVIGDARPGPRGLVIIDDGARVDGETAPRDALVELEDVRQLESPHFEPFTVATDQHAKIASGDRGFSRLELQAGATLEISGPARLLVDHLYLREGARIEIDGERGPVELHVLADFVLESDAQLGSLDNEPTDLIIHLAADNLRQAGPRIDFTGDTLERGGRLYGHVYAPDAMIVLDGDFELHGGLVAGVIRLDDRARVVGSTRGR